MIGKLLAMFRRKPITEPSVTRVQVGTGEGLDKWPHPLPFEPGSPPLPLIECLPPSVARNSSSARDHGSGKKNRRCYLGLSISRSSGGCAG